VGITGAADFCPTSEARRAVIRCGVVDKLAEDTGATGEKKPGRNGPVTERPERSTEDLSLTRNEEGMSPTLLPL
jgi:hypothetical protein